METLKDTNLKEVTIRIILSISVATKKPCVQTKLEIKKLSQSQLNLLKTRTYRNKCEDKKKIKKTW